MVQEMTGVIASSISFSLLNTNAAAPGQCRENSGRQNQYDSD